MQSELLVYRQDAKRPHYRSRSTGVHRYIEETHTFLMTSGTTFVLTRMPFELVPALDGTNQLFILLLILSRKQRGSLHSLTRFPSLPHLMCHLL